MGEARILLIDNTRAKRTSFASALMKRYEVIRVPSGKQALVQAAAHPPAVVVLDAISMRTPGDRIVRSLRAKLPQIPLIHLHPGAETEADSEADIILCPPFTARKLVNSIERLFASNPVAMQQDGDLLVCGAFAMHPGRRVLLLDGQEKALTPKQAALIEIFFRNPGVTLAREALMQQVWHTNYMGDTRTLDVHIRWIRRAIEPDPGRPRYLKTVRGVGYRLDIATETADAAVITEAEPTFAAETEMMLSQA